MPIFTFTHWPGIPISLLLHLIPTPVAAKLPFNSQITQPVLKHSNEVSFDPLGVAAVLYNPRADISAARLYMQPDRSIFRWHHTMMIGGTLTPLSVLVDYLTSKMSSLHPAVSMCLRDRIMLRVRSTMVFSELPISMSNAWLHDVLAFKSSLIPENDFAVAEVEDIFVQPNIRSPKAIESIVTGNDTPPVKSRSPFLTLLDLLGYFGGLLILTGLVFSILTGDVWAISLFGIYALHCLASTIIAYNPLVKPQDNTIVLSSKPEYFVYQRPEGGTIVFKGRKDTLERWARLTWKFDPTPYNHFLHGFWTITGTMAAIASVACMVNMAAVLQLGFLGLMGYSSLAEILATQIGWKLQAEARGEVVRNKDRHSVEPTFLRENPTRSKGIIRATLMCELDEKMWFTLKLLPAIAPFKKMLDLLNELKTVKEERDMLQKVQAYRDNLGVVPLAEGIEVKKVEDTKINKVEDTEGEKVDDKEDKMDDQSRKLAGRIADEREDAWREVRNIPKEV